MFKRGNYAKCVSNCAAASCGEVMLIEDSNSWSFWIRSKRTGKLHEYSQDTRHWKRAVQPAPVTKEAPMKKEKKDSKYLYTFTTSPDNVDYDKIYQDSVSGDKPLAIIKVKGQDRCVAVVHESILRKGWGMEGKKMIKVMGEEVPEAVFELESLGAYFGGHFDPSYLIDPKTCSRIKELVAEIHHAKWAKAPVRVTVQQVEV